MLDATTGAGMPRIRRTWFSLDGCMSRRKFVIAELLLAVAVLLAVPLEYLLFAIIAQGLHIGPDQPGFVAAAVLWGLTLAVPTLWAAAAPMVKRCRDAGLPPVAMLGAVFLMPILDRMMLAPVFSARLAWPLDWMTPLGGALIASALLLMACMPCRYVVRERETAAGAVEGAPA
jgi:uncharacterized membrane protein YhaH (DUF805 family)